MSLLAVVFALMACILNANSFQLGKDFARPNLHVEDPSRALQVVNRRAAIQSISSLALLLSQPAMAKEDKPLLQSEYQAVWSDPKHPNGYRVLFGDSTKATLLVRDSPSDNEKEVPVTVDGMKLVFDLVKVEEERWKESLQGIEKVALYTLPMTRTFGSTRNTKDQYFEITPIPNVSSLFDK